MSTEPESKTYSSSQEPTSPFFRLPGELRNIIYDLIATTSTTTTALLITSDKILHSHPLAHVNHQLRLEFLPILHATHQTHPPAHLHLLVPNFNFTPLLPHLTTLAHLSPLHTTFHLHTPITQPLLRSSSWKNLWPWVQFCDTLLPKARFPGKSLATEYLLTREMEPGEWDREAASHELYVETMPYMLRGAGGPYGMFAGYEEIRKIRGALRRCG